MTHPELPERNKQNQHRMLLSSSYYCCSSYSLISFFLSFFIFAMWHDANAETCLVVQWELCWMSFVLYLRTTAVTAATTTRVIRGRKKRKNVLYNRPTEIVVNYCKICVNKGDARKVMAKTSRQRHNCSWVFSRLVMWHTRGPGVHIHIMCNHTYHKRRGSLVMIMSNWGWFKNGTIIQIHIKNCNK